MGGKPERRHDLDWLRVLATFGVIIFHTWRMFDPDDWEVKNNSTTEVIMILVLFWAQWMMPIFFTISGASIFYSLGFRSPGQFIKARIVRILIPLLTVGVFVLSPPQEFIRLVTHGMIPPDSSFFGLYPEYLKQHRPEIGFPYFGYPTYHLWYLYFLFVFSIVLLPVFWYLGSEKGTNLMAQLSKYFKRSWTIYLFALPLCLLASVLDPRTQWGNLNSYGGWSIPIYFLILFYGYVLVSHEQFEKSLYAQGRSAIFLSIFTYVAMLIAIMKLGIEGLFDAHGTPVFWFLMSWRAFSMWCFIIAILYIGKRYFSYTNRKLQYLSEGSLPFYMLHQTIIVIIGFWIMNWQMGIFTKWVILFVATFIGIFGVYELAIRRFNPVRFLFGLKPVKGKNKS